MSVFTEKELEYMGTQKLARLATIDSAGDPHVTPVGLHYNPETDTIDVGGHSIASTLKWAHARRHPRVSLAVDDVLPPWRPRSVLVQADAEILQEGGQSLGPGFSPEVMRLHPVRITSWGLGEEKSSREVKS